MPSTSIVLLFWTLAIGLFAQKTERIEACGRCAMGNNQTLQEVQQCALDKAFEEALNKAGVPLEVSGSTQMQQSESGNAYTEAFSKVVQTQYKGGITDFKELGEIRKTINEFNLVELERCIRATVVHYKTKSDPAFMHRVTGILPAYPYEALLQFQVQSPGSYMLGYLLQGDSAIQFYPNPYERQVFLAPETLHAFPSPKSQSEYFIENSQPKEAKSILLLFLKEATPAPPVQLRQELMRWIDGIEPSQREVLNFPIILSSKK